MENILKQVAQWAMNAHLRPSMPRRSNMGFFQQSRTCNSKLDNAMWPSFKLIWYFMSVLVICKFHKDLHGQWHGQAQRPHELRHDKINKVTVRPAKTQISLGIRSVWSESSLCAQWVAKDPSFLHVDSEDSDQTGRMPRLIWVFAGRTCHFVGFVTRRLSSCLQHFPHYKYTGTFFSARWRVTPKWKVQSGPH